MSDLTVPTNLLRPLGSHLPASGTPEQLRQVAEDFEASFLSQMLQPMFAGLSTEAPFGGGAGEETWRSFLIDAMARQTARAGGIGLADSVQRELIALQSGSAEPTVPVEPV